MILRSRPARNPRAFTLLELLVSIAVLAVLLALLLPALGRMRREHEALQCVAQLRQLGVGITLFMGEHDGVIPPATEQNCYPGPFFGKRVPEWGPTWGEYLAAVYFNGDKSLLRCPSRPASFNTGSGNYIDYGLNQRLGPSADGTRPGLKLAAIPRPANTILVADAAFYSGGVARSGFYRILGYTDLHPRHLGSTVNTLYVDLHVERIPLDLAHPPADTAPLGRGQFLP